MKKNPHKKHIQFGLLVLALSGGVLTTTLLWDMGKIDLPQSWVYYARQVSARVADKPKPTFELPVQFHRQEHALSCEPATLKMVLDYYGVVLSESEIISKMPFDNTPKRDGVWGDPDKGFVGNIDGKMPSTGYGIHWGPLAETARNWKNVEVIEGATPRDLTEHLLAGRPVIVWGYLGRGRPISWRTPEGKIINTVVAEHTRVVYGFRGSKEDPDGFFVMDPTYGPSYWERTIFLKNWGVLGRKGLVVYP